LRDIDVIIAEQVVHVQISADGTKPSYIEVLFQPEIAVLGGVISSGALGFYVYRLGSAPNEIDAVRISPSAWNRDSNNSLPRSSAAKVVVKRGENPERQVL
jgi:hypothetical protein